MSIGETLAASRRRAALTLAEVSQRTRIRETIIRDIEADDYASCGGDFYARGHIRAIAKVVGADPSPLIEEYDSAHGPFGGIPSETLQPPDAPAPGAGARDGGAPGGEAPGAGATGGGRPGAGVGDTLVTGAAGAVPPMPGALIARPAGEPRRRRLNWTAVLALALLAAVAFLGYRLIKGPPGASASGAGRATSHSGGSASHGPAASAKASPTGSSPLPSLSPGVTRTLAPASVTAFGSGGSGGGDNPQLAPLAIDRSVATAWHSDWYTTARFGNLYPGTGLLLDMGAPVTITGARITLGGVVGAGVELRVGSAPVLSDLRTVARETGVAGGVPIRLASPARGRYVLVWFTELPADASGTFQASVYDIRVQGRG